MKGRECQPTTHELTSRVLLTAHGTGQSAEAEQGVGVDSGSDHEGYVDLDAVD